MLFAEVVATWDTVRETRSRKAKVSALADLLRRLPSNELGPGAAMLAGGLRQGRIGVGWAAVSDIDVPPAERATLTIKDVDGVLDVIAEVAGTGSQQRRRTLLEQLWRRATGQEQELLVGLLLGNLRQGALEGVVLQAVAEAAGAPVELVRRAAMLSGDATVAAVTAMDGGIDRLAEIRLEVMQPVQPMLAQSAGDVAEAIERTGRARVETKLDGMRIQVHRRADEVLVVTRSLRDVTSALPRVVEVARSLPTREFILDGEALATDQGGRPLAFQESMQAESESGMQPWFFDVLRVDGTDLIDEPLTNRHARLTELVGVEHLVDGIETADVDEATAHLRNALERGHEGVVVKECDSTYEAGRRGAGWIKVKVAHTLDLVVLAVEWGSGRRRGWLSNLHLGAIDAESGQPVMLGKTFKGMTDEMLAWQTDALLALEESRDGHVVHVRPELVVEVAFDGVQSSRRYPGGVTLRFARVKRYRTDKRASDADTLQSIQAIHRGEITPIV